MKNKFITRKNRIMFLIIALVIHFTVLFVFSKVYQTETNTVKYFSFFFPVFAVYIYAKLILATKYNPVFDVDAELEDEYDDAKVSIVIPFFNEDPKLIEKQIESLLDQTKPFENIYYIDDGSSDKAAAELLRVVQKEVPNITFIELEENVGKRHAQGAVLSSIDTEYIMTTDSDSVLEKDCLAELMKPFYIASNREDNPVVAVTGKVLAINENDTWLTKILNMRYFNSFESERAAHSVTGSVIVASGPCTVYKTDILQENLNEYLQQKFLNKVQTYGDDRCLTNIFLQYGKVLYQSTAVVATEIPHTMKQFIKQQLRWNRSFFRESVLGIAKSVKNKSKATTAWISLEIFMFITIFFTFLLNLYYIVFVPGNTLFESTFFFGFIIVNSIIRNIYYLKVDILNFLKAPIYGLIHMFILLPVKLIALCTLKETRWGTR